jgi:hypothetical protein
VNFQSSQAKQKQKNFPQNLIKYWDVTRSLCSGTLPGRGSALGAISIDSITSTAVSIDFTAIFFNVAVSYDEEGVVLPRG